MQRNTKVLLLVVGLVVLILYSTSPGNIMAARSERLYDIYDNGVFYLAFSPFKLTTLTQETA